LNSITNILKKPIVKIFSLNGISVLVRIVGGLVTSKISAAYIGAGGFAIVGNLRNFLTTVEAYATLGMQNGIIKYTAENQKDEQKLYSVLSTVFLSLLGVVLCITLLLLAFSGYWSEWIFGNDEQYAWVFKVLAFSLPCMPGALYLWLYLMDLVNIKK